MRKERISNIETVFSEIELKDLFHQGQDIPSFLDRVVNRISSHMETDACSIYVFHENKNKLYLQATTGQDRELIGEISVPIENNAIGRAMNELCCIREDKTANRTMMDQNFQSFLAVPIRRGKQKVGVLVIQDKDENQFTNEDVIILTSIASQLAVTLENAQILIEGPQKRKRKSKQTKSNLIIRGTPAVEGATIGYAYVVEGPRMENLLLSIRSEKFAIGIEGLHKAIEQTEEQLEHLQAYLEGELSDVASLIFSAHLLMLRDNSFMNAMEKLINKGMSAHAAVVQVVNKYIAIFKESDNHTIREKTLDIKDLGHRILKNLSIDKSEDGDYTGQIIITNELYPSELLKLAAQNANGIILFGGGITSHVSVLARSLKMPLIHTEDKTIFNLADDVPMALDAFRGLIYIRPDKEVTARIEALKTKTSHYKELEKNAREKTFTADGQQIYLRATANILADLKIAQRIQAEGIGLYRSEFPFLIRNNFPTEEEQYHTYKSVITALPNPLVTLRTLDVGGDKILNYLPDTNESNPFLGLRGIRFLLANKTIFVDQLKAMLRASAKYGKVRIVFPLISSLDDFRNAKNVVLETITILEQKHQIRDIPMPDLGALIELPSATWLADELANECDFLSIGTNDLIQYTLGVDRTNEKVADLFATYHPSVLRSIKRVATAAQKAKCPLCVCGIMASDVKVVYHLIGMGITEFSLEPDKIPGIQQSVAKMNYSNAKQAAQAISTMGTLAEIREHIRELNL